jgi:hypothetical protein
MSTIFRRFSLFSWIDRRRGDYNNSKNGRKEEGFLEAYDTNSKHIRDTSALATNKIESSFNVGVLDKQKQRELVSSFHLLFGGIESPSSISGFSTFFGDKAKTYDENSGILFIENEPVSGRPNYETPNANYFRYKGAKFEAIGKISKEEVRGISVYNLKTIDECYLAEGFLVHNCRIPCIATDCTGMKELLDESRGYLVPATMIHRDCFGNGRRYWIDIKQTVSALKQVKQGILPDVDKAQQYVYNMKWQETVDFLNNELQTLMEHENE